MNVNFEIFQIMPYIAAVEKKTQRKSNIIQRRIVSFQTENKKVLRKLVQGLNAIKLAKQNMLL